MEFPKRKNLPLLFPVGVGEVKLGIKGHRVKEQVAQVTKDINKKGDRDCCIPRF